MKKNIQVTGHVAGNDFNQAYSWTVANFNNMQKVEQTEYVGNVSETLVSYYEERGYYDVTITETGMRFGKKYLVSMKAMRPEITTFKTEWQAREYAKTL